MNNCELILKKCKLDSVKDIMLLQQSVFEEIGLNKSILRMNSKEMFIKCVQHPNISIGLYDDKLLVGICILFDGAGTEEDLSTCVLNQNVSNSINLKLIMIKRAYQGMSFQCLITWISEKIAGKRGYKYLCATVDPNNYYSLNNCMKCGFKVDHKTIKYGGYERFILVKKINYQEYSSKLEKEVISKFDSKYYGYNEIQNFININNCYKGEEELISNGDIIEYTDNSGKKYYSIYSESNANAPTKPSNKNSCDTILPSNVLNNLTLTNIWINPIKNI